MGTVYLLIAVDLNGLETFKIGTTTRDVKKRINELQTGNPNKISLLKTYESKHYKKIEKWLHSNFSNVKTNANNEWFELPDNKVISFVNECKKAETTIEFLLKENPFSNNF